MPQVVFRILGPLNIDSGTVPVVLQGGRQRTIMSMLLLAPNRVVSIDALADAVWDGCPPATARNQVAICVSALRKALKAAGGTGDLLVTSHPGYMLLQGEHRIDAVEFGQSVAEGREAARGGRLEEACAHFEEALAMWRGRPLEGITAQPVEAESDRLMELRLAVYEEYMELRLERGRHREAIGELTAFVREHPLREQALYCLMLAQYRSDRRAEALESYRVGREVLAERLGIDPGRALQQLHQDILADAPVLSLPAEPVVASSPAFVPAHLPSSVAALTGRADELAALDRLLDKLDGSALAVGSITGIAGVGKSALAVHWAHQVAGRFPDGQLFADMRGYDPEETPRQPGAVLDRFLRAMGVPSTQIPADLQERAELFRSALDGRRVLIVLDDARSFRQIRPLLPGSGRCCVLVTSRDSMGSSLAGDYGLVQLHLGALGEDAAIALLARAAGNDRIAADPAAAARLSILCDRLPLALRIAAARLAAKPHWSVRTLVSRLEDQHRRLDELSPDERGVRAGLRLSYRDLRAAARMFRLLSTLNVPDFAAWTGAAVLDIGLFDAEDLIEELVDAQMLVPLNTPDGQVRYRFQELPRLFARECALAEESEEERRAALRRALGAWLGLATEAHRRVYGGDFTVIHGPAPRFPLPQPLMEGLLKDPMGWFESECPAITGLVDQAVRENESAYAWDLTLTSVTLFQSRNYLEDWRHCVDRSLTAVRRSGDVLGEAAMLQSLGTLEIVQWNHRAALDHLTGALGLFEELDEDQGRALVLRNLALCERQAGNIDRARELGQRSLELFRKVGDRYSETYLLGILARIELERGRPETSLLLSSEAVARSRGLGSTRGEAQSTVRLAEALLHQGDGEQAEEASRRALDLVRAAGDRRGEAHALCTLGEALWCQGLTEEAEAILREAHLTASKVPDRHLEARASVVLGSVLSLRADHAGAMGLLRAAAELFAQVGDTGLRARAVRLLDLVGSGKTPGSAELFALVQH